MAGRLIGERKNVGSYSSFCLILILPKLEHDAMNIWSDFPFKTIGRIWSKRCAPRFVHCFCFFTARLLTTWLTSDWQDTDAIGSRSRQCSP